MSPSRDGSEVHPTETTRFSGIQVPFQLFIQQRVQERKQVISCLPWGLGGRNLFAPSMRNNSWQVGHFHFDSSQKRVYPVALAFICKMIQIQTHIRSFVDFIFLVARRFLHRSKHDATKKIPVARITQNMVCSIAQKTLHVATRGNRTNNLLTDAHLLFPSSIMNHRPTLHGT
mmetsp:Transcript_1199/g.3087  ORF Transcript_1199/g.3087 Transcript_1199/m.3087 type:complete len:173 (+) Transcript_1199:349-867(+)